MNGLLKFLRPFRQHNSGERVGLPFFELKSGFWILAYLLTSIGSMNVELKGQLEDSERGNVIINRFLGEHSYRIHGDGTNEFATKAELLASKSVLKKEYFYMLGLDPMPEKTPLRATKTGELKGDGYVVEMIHFQSSPGLYVTGNLYRPESVVAGEKLPTILYVCGHADRGRDGNKAAYQSNGIWFARHGYVCLMIDTLQRGEIAGIHHGTYRENRWWWHSRGYTSAGVECWNGIRALDYLTTRSDVDANRMGVTGISGGGAATFWIAAADERVKAAVPISGMADLPSYVADRVVDEHCDCMFLHNTYRWPTARIGALIAPRPLLFVNSDKDPIFPMDANHRVSNRLEDLYSLFGAGDQVETVVSMGGHAYREDIRKAVYRFLNIHLKGDSSPVLDSEVDLVVGERGREVHPILPERLRVFPTDADIPKDQRNTVIDQHFVPTAQLDSPDSGDYKNWKEGLVERLRAVVFRSFPERIPPAGLESMDGPEVWTLETESGIEVSLRSLSTTPQGSRPERIVLIVNLGDAVPASEFKRTDAVYLLDPRGVGATKWSSRNPPNYVARSHALLGRTVDEGRVWDVAAVSRYLLDHYENRLPLVVAGRGAGAVVSAYAMLFESEIGGGVFEKPILSHMDPESPPFLNVLRVCDVPDILGSLAPRPLLFRDVEESDLLKVTQIYESAQAGWKLRLD